MHTGPTEMSMIVQGKLSLTRLNNTYKRISASSSSNTVSMLLLLQGRGELNVGARNGESSSQLVNNTQGPAAKSLIFVEKTILKPVELQ
jgi:hypothetical protein